MDVTAATEFLARSTTMTSVGWIGYIIIGAIAGWLAGKIVKGGGSGILMNIVIGVVGALIGGFLLSSGSTPLRVGGGSPYSPRSSGR
jgi:uncharacterized membrane protein YeaQ/YmgE (transglycosylase-associated protein family)